MLFGASQGGKDFFADFVATVMENSKGVPLVVLTYPVLISASVCASLNVRNVRRTCLCPLKPNRWKVRGMLRPFFQHFITSHGDGNFDLYAFVFLLIPLLVCGYFGIQRRVVSSGLSLPRIVLGLQSLQSLNEEAASELTKGTGNAIAMVAILAMALFLIPASKHGPILKLFGWSPVRTIRLHIWCGRIIVIASLIHGLFHALRWKYQLGEDFVAFLFPPRQCWTNPAGFAPTCKNPNISCTCYDHFVYFTGTLAGVLLVLIFITSSNWVRRKCYSFFLTCHLLLGPLCFLVVIFHYHSAILYLSPSILYYIATSLPPYLESRRGAGIQIVSVEVIGTGTNKYISLTFKATPEAVQAYRPGMYTTLSVPSISHVAHPFTVNKVTGKEDQLRIIFRVMGTFTKTLAILLEAEAGIPIIHMDGLHCCASRLQQVRHHDVNVLVAGGVGVTPFLSLFGEAVETNDDIANHHPSRMRRLSFHWMCRDSSLIEYIRREYLYHLDGKPTPTFECEIQIHQTTPGNGEVSIKMLAFPSETVHIYKPFRLSRFSASSTVIWNTGRFLSLSLLLWPGVAVIWHCFRHFQIKKEMRGRGYAPLFLLSYMVLASYFFARILPRSWFGNKDKEEFKLRDDSDHSNVEIFALSRCPSAGQIGQTMDQENPLKVTLELIEDGRPELDTLLECLDDAQWPAIYCCGPACMTQMLREIAADKSRARMAVEPSRSSPLITIYDEVFLM